MENNLNLNLKGGKLVKLGNQGVFKLRKQQLTYFFVLLFNVSK